MVQSKADDADGYLAEVPEERRDALGRLRLMCRQELKGFGEIMAYGMPAYERDGVTEIAFASQKNYVSFYLLRTDVRAAFEERWPDRTWARAACASASRRTSTSTWCATC
jgi:uncharacterized protein YdhG (YjbR/CyaY superfamily)